MTELPARHYPDEIDAALKALVPFRDRWREVAQGGAYGPHVIAELHDLRRAVDRAIRLVDPIVYENRKSHVGKRMTPGVLHQVAQSFTVSSAMYQYEREIISEFIEPERVDLYLKNARSKLGRLRNKSGHPVPFIDATPVSGFQQAWKVPNSRLSPASKERMARRQVEHIDAVIMLLTNCRSNVTDRLFAISLCMASGTGIKKR